MTFTCFEPDDAGPSQAGFEQLNGLKGLQEITIEGFQPSVTDSVFQALAGAPDLLRLNIIVHEATRRYTSAGIAAFRERRPDVHLHVDGKDYPGAVP